MPSTIFSINSSLNKAKMQNERNLPVLFSPKVMVLERPSMRPKMFEIIWTKAFFGVNYRTTVQSLMAMRGLVDNNDLSLVESSKKGIYDISLSLIDVWSGKGPFPSIPQINWIIARSGKEPAGVVEMNLFAQEMERRRIAISAKYFLAIAPRDSLQRGEVEQFPSISQDEEHGVMLGLTYDWVIEQHHVYVLVIDVL